MGVDFSEILESEPAHILDRKGDPRPAGAIILDAKILGRSLYTLCGQPWSRSDNPLLQLACEKCLAIHDSTYSEETT